jgi:hypothetical protein
VADLRCRRQAGHCDGWPGACYSRSFTCRPDRSSAWSACCHGVIGRKWPKCWCLTSWPPTTTVAPHGLTGHPDSVRRPSASPATGQYCRPACASDQSSPSTESIEFRLDGLTDEHHIVACPPRTATERRRSAPKSYFRAPQASKAHDRARPAEYPAGTCHRPPVDLRRQRAQASPNDPFGASDSADERMSISATRWHLSPRLQCSVT